jgi:transcriptional regulator with XRE-family HTH domain
MTAKQIKLALVDNEVNLSEIAREFGVTPSHVSQVARKKRRSPEIEDRLARAIKAQSAEAVFGRRRLLRSA